MRTFAFYFILLLLAPFISCKKTGHASQKGTVSETGTNTPIQGATVILQYWKDNCSSCPYFFDSTYTDSEGRFALYFRKKINHQYRLIVRDNDHYGYGGAIISEKTNNNWQVSLNAAAYIKFRIKKMTNSNRRISMHDVQNKIDFSFAHNGSPVDTILPFVVRVKVNEATRFSWTISQSYPDNPESTNYSVNVSIAKKETQIYTIQYD